MSDDVLTDLAAQPAPQPPPLSPALEAELGTIAPVAPRRPVRQLATLAGLSLVYGAGLLVAVTTRRDLHEMPVAYLIAAAIAWLCGFVAASYLSLVPRPGAVTPRWRWAAISAIVTSIAFVTLGLVVHPTAPSSLHFADDQLLRHGYACLGIGLGGALVPVIAGALFLRGALPVGARGVAAALGAAGGCLGGLVLHAHCPITDALHLGLIHGGVVVIAALVAAAVVPRATDQPLR